MKHDTLPHSYLKFKTTQNHVSIIEILPNNQTKKPTSSFQTTCELDRKECRNNSNQNKHVHRNSHLIKGFSLKKERKNKVLPAHGPSKDIFFIRAKKQSGSRLTEKPRPDVPVSNPSRPLKQCRILSLKPVMPERVLNPTIPFEYYKNGEFSRTLLMLWGSLRLVDYNVF